MKNRQEKKMNIHERDAGNVRREFEKRGHTEISQIHRRWGTVSTNNLSGARRLEKLQKNAWCFSAVTSFISNC